jgi:hypothetical protein
MDKDGYREFLYRKLNSLQNGIHDFSDIHVSRDIGIPIYIHVYSDTEVQR